MGHPRSTSPGHDKVKSASQCESTHSSTSSSGTPKKRSSKRLDPHLLPILTPPAENSLSHTYELASPASASTSTGTAMSSKFDSSTTRYGSASGTDTASTPSSRSVSGSSSVKTADADLHYDNCHFASSLELRMVDSPVTMLTQDCRNGGQGSGAQR